MHIWQWLCILLFRTELMIATKSALQLVIKGRVKFSNLSDHLCTMIELFLILREKCFVPDDNEFTALIHKQWHLYSFIQELIQALLPKKTFGGVKKQFSKEIAVSGRLSTIKLYHIITLFTRSGLDLMKLAVLKFLKWSGTVLWKRLLKKEFLEWYVVNNLKILYVIVGYSSSHK